MAHAIREARKEIHLVCVDTWDENWKWWITNDTPRPAFPSQFVEQKLPLFEAFSQCIHATRDQRIVHPLRETSLDAAKMFKDRSLDFVFIDADHNYESVKVDIAAWRSKVKPGGILAGHDYGNSQWPGVKQAVDEALGDRVVRVPASTRATGPTTDAWLVRM